MAKQSMNPVPYLKHMEAYNDFSGGLNTVASDDNLKDNEFTDLVNVDLAERGPAKRRTGMTRHLNAPVAGTVQGYFRYFKADGTMEEILAIGGKLYYKRPLVPDPSTAPTLATSGTTGTLPAGTYYVKYTWVNNHGETKASPVSSITTVAGQQIDVTIPALPARVTSANVYIGTVSGSETKQGNTTATTYSKTDTLVAGTALPTTNTTDTIVELPITGLASFQTTRQVEAVQYNDKLYIATGTKFVQYDGTTAAVVTPYQPEAMEVLYIGTNALADNPDQFISDSTSAYVQVTGVTLNKRYGVANKPTTFTAYVAKPSGATVEYQWEWRPVGVDTWNLVIGFGASKSVDVYLSTGDYQIRCTARLQGETDPTKYSEYLVPKYTVKEVADGTKVEDTSTIHQCNRILLHWERVILYGDPNQKDMIYVSDVGRPDYVPTLNTLRFENTEKEELTALVKFRDMLVAFTPHTIQGLYGKSPYDYSRMYLSTSVGCIAPYSAQVFENYIGFLSLEGVYILKSVGYSESRINVQKIDSNTQNIIPRDKDACACVADGQYQLVFPTKEKRFRFYYQRGVWTKDESPKLNFSRMYEFSGEVYGQASDGILKMDGTVFSDDGYVYTDRYVFKAFDFDAPYNPKKLKELQILLGQTQATKLSLWIYADGASIINPDTSYASVNDLGEVVWNTQSTPNINIQTGTVLGSWIMGKSPFGSVESGIYYVTLSGKCRKVQLEIEHSDATPNTVLGLGFIYKLRKP